MKKQFLALCNAQKQRLVAQRNTLAETERAIVDESIKELESIIAEAEKMEEETTALDALRKMLDAIETKIKAIEEKMEDPQANPQPVQVENWLKSKEAVSAFANAIRKSVRNRTSLNDEWVSEMSNSITFNPNEYGVLYPEVVKSKINDLWNTDKNWLNQLHNSRAKVFAVRYNEASEDSTDNRAKGHQKGATKTDQSLTIKALKVETQMIYKMVPIDKITEFNDDGALVEYVIDELYRQWKYEIMRAILIGDGRPAASPDKINSFTAIDRAATDSWVGVRTLVAANQFVDEIMSTLDLIKQKEDVILFMNKADITSLRRRLYGAGGTPIYVSMAQIAEELGVSQIVETSLMTTNSGEARAIAMCPRGYVTVGEMTEPRYETWYDFMKNQTYYRQEAPVGGAPELLGMGAVLKNA